MTLAIISSIKDRRLQPFDPTVILLSSFALNSCTIPLVYFTIMESSNFSHINGNLLRELCSIEHHGIKFDLEHQ